VGLVLHSQCSIGYTCNTAKAIYRNVLHSCNTVLSDVFFVFLLNNFINDCVLQTIFMPKSDATRSVWCAFENYVVL